MNSRMSFCNKSVIKSDLKRFWWITALHTILLFFSYTMIVLNRFYSRDYYSPVNAKTDFYLFHDCYSIFVFACIVPVVLGVMLFSYLNSSKSTCAMHSIPISRRTLYVSHYVSGVILFALPVIINSLVLLAFMLDSDFASEFGVWNIIKPAHIGLLYSLLTFSAACAVAQICANSVASLILTYGFGLMPMFAELYTNYLLEKNLFGFVTNNYYSVSAFLYKEPFALLKWKWALMYIGISLVFAVIGYLIYKVRKLEKNSEVLAFDVLKPLFVIIIGIYAGAIGYAYFDGVWEINNLVFVIPTGLLGVVIAQMIVKKSLKPEGVLKNALIYTAICLVMIGVFKADITGYQNRIPKANEVEYVIFEPGVNQTRNECYHFVDGKQVFYDIIVDNKLTDAEDISNVIALHKQIVTMRKTGGTRTVEMEYKLKNGKSLKRNYLISYEDYRDVFKPIAENDTVRKAYFPILAYDGRKILNIYVSVNGNEYEITNDRQRVLEALKTDLQEASADVYAIENYQDFMIRVSFEKPCHFADGTKANDFGNYESELYQIRPSYINTLALLEELNIPTDTQTSDEKMKK